MGETEAMQVWHELIAAWQAHFEHNGGDGTKRAVMKLQQRLYALAPADFALLDRAARDSARAAVAHGLRPIHAPSPVDAP